MGIRERLSNMFLTDMYKEKIVVHMMHLSDMLEQLSVLQKIGAAEFQRDRLLQLAAARALHISIEAVTDGGGLIIDALLMRDPSSYEDIIQVLADEGVFSTEIVEDVLALARFRKKLTHDYVNFTNDELFQFMARMLLPLQIAHHDLLNYIRTESAM